MKFAAAAAVLAAGVSAGSNVTYTTEVVTAFTTYCPAATTLSHNGQTYTITEATTLTITNCPCTISKPVYSTSSVSCSTCAPASSAVATTYPVSSAKASSSAASTYPVSSAPVAVSSPASYPNSTLATAATTSKAVGTGGYTTSAAATGSTTAASSVPTAGAGKAAALSGAGLAGVLGLVAYVL